MILIQTQLHLIVIPAEPSTPNIEPTEPLSVPLSDPRTYLSYVVESVTAMERITKRYGAPSQAHAPLNIIDKILSA